MFWSKLCMVASCYLPMFPWSGVHSLWFLALGKRDRPEVLSDAQATLNRPTWEQWEYTQMAISMGRLIKTKNIRGTLFSDKTICVMTWFSTEDFQQILPFNDKQNPMEYRSEQRTYCETPPRMSCSALLKMQESPSSGRAKNGCLVIWNRFFFGLFSESHWRNRTKLKSLVVSNHRCPFPIGWLINMINRGV